VGLRSTNFLVVKTLQQDAISGLQSAQLLAFWLILVTVLVLVPFESIIQMAPPAGWAHSRRDRPSVNNGNMGKVFSDPTYFWSTDVRSKKLVPEYLLSVREGIQKAALELRFSLDEDDLAWLESHQGRFQMYIPVFSEHYKKKVTSVQLKDKSLDEIAEHCLTKNHQVLGKSLRFCRTAAVGNYQASMETSLRNLWNFLAMIGAYQCMLLLLPHPPTECCSVSSRSLKAYILHKFLPHRTPLHESWDQGDGAIVDICGRPMLCEGTVQNKDGFDCLLAALTHLHDHSAKKLYSAGYVLQCIGCFSKFKQGAGDMSRFDACEAHAGNQSRYCCMGNPTPSTSIKTLVDWMDKESERRGYQVKEKSFILPQDLLDLQKHVASVNYNMWDFQNYVVLLGGIQTAGRFDGYGDSHMEDFSLCKDLFDISDHGIKSLAQRVKEKTDKIWHKYLLFFNDACPQICYLRHLLVFVHCANLVENSRLFTEEEELKHSDFSTPNTWSRCLDKHKFHSWLQDRVDQNFQAGELMDIGVNSPRSTFYLFFILSGGHFPDAMRNARHQTEHQARKYHRDAVACRDKLLALGNLPRFPPWKDTLVHKQGTVQKRIMQLSSTRKEVPHLKAAAQFFVESMLHITSNHGKYRDPRFLLEIACKKNFSTSASPSLVGDMKQAIASLPVEYQGHMNHQLAGLLSKLHQCPTCPGSQQNQAMNGHSPHLAVAGGQQEGLRPEQPTTGQSPRRRLRLLVLTELLGRWKYDFVVGFSDALKSLTSDGQSELLYELYSEICSLQVTPGDKTLSYIAGRRWIHSKNNFVFSRYLNAFCKCIQSCHGDDLKKFQLSNPDFKKARPNFKCSICGPQLV
jgi:hypothetical protein